MRQTRSFSLFPKEPVGKCLPSHHYLVVTESDGCCKSMVSLPLFGAMLTSPSCLRESQGWVRGDLSFCLSPQNDTSGEYKKALLKLCGGDDE